MSCVHWMMIMPARFPATTPMIWVATRMAGTNVWAMSAARGPNFLTTQPATKRFSVPVSVRTYVGLVDRTIATAATTANVPHSVVLMPRMLNCVAVPAAISSLLQRSPVPLYGGCVS